MRGRLRIGRLWLACALLGASPSRAAWMEAGSDHFLVYGDVSPQRIENFANRLERFDQAMRIVMKLDNERPAPANRLTVYIVSNAAAVQKLCGAGCRDIYGFYEPRASGSVAFTPARAGSGTKYELNADIVLFHEYAHHLLMSSNATMLPGWLNEGFAEFASTSTIDKDGAVEVGRVAVHRAYGLMVAEQMPVARLLAADRGKLSAEDREQVYSRGWLLTHYLVFTPEREGQLARYLALLGKGQPPLAAGKEAFGDLTVLDRALDTYKRQTKWKILVVGPNLLHVGVVAVRPLRPGEAALMPDRLRSDRGVTRDTAMPLAADASARAAAFADDPWVQGVLAEMQFDAGQDDAAEAAADRALAKDAKSIQALTYKGLVHLRRAAADPTATPQRWQEARGWLVKANHLEPDAANPLVRYYDSFALAKQPPPDSARRGLERAAVLVPQDLGVRTRLALCYVEDGKLPEARAALAALAFDPHAAPDNAAAKLVAMIDAGADAPTVAAAAKKDADTGDKAPGASNGR